MGDTVARSGTVANPFLRRIAGAAAPALAAGIALAIRMWFIAGFSASPLFDGTGGAHDRALYHAEALRVAQGHVWPDGSFAYLPLYPWLLGATYAMGEPGPKAAAALGIAADTLTAALLVLLALRLGARAASAALAGIAYAAYPLAVSYSGLPMPIATNTLLVIAWAHAAVAAATPARRFGAGLLGGFAALGVPALIPALAGVALLDAARRRSACALAILAGAALPLAPVSIHNSRAEGRFVLLSTHGGFNFYMGNHERATGYTMRIGDFRMTAGHMLEDAHRAAEQAERRALARSQSSSWWAERGRASRREHPLRAARLYAKKVALFWNRNEVDDLRIVEMQRLVDGRFTSPLWPGASMFAAAGVFALLLRRTRAELRIALVAATLATAAAFVTSRYRMPFIPIALAAAAAAIDAAWRARRDARERRVSLAAGLGAVIFCALPFPVRDQYAVDAYNASQYLIAAQRFEEADARITDALRMESANPDLFSARGTIRYRQERFAEAADAFAASLAARPSNSGVRFNLVLSLARAGRPCEAIDAAGEPPHEDRLSTLLNTLRELCDDRAAGRDSDSPPAQSPVR